jgi:hypothetical protein
LWKTKAPQFQALRTPANAADFTVIDHFFAKLDGMVDALGDMLVANSVHQVAQGNFNRTGLTSTPFFAASRFRSGGHPHASPGSGLSHRVFEFLTRIRRPLPPGKPTHSKPGHRPTRSSTHGPLAVCPIRRM